VIIAPGLAVNPDAPDGDADPPVGREVVRFELAGEMEIRSPAADVHVKRLDVDALDADVSAQPERAAE
jgi:hypothetical protein